MEGTQIHPWDWKRALLGSDPVGFLGEVAVRTVIVYVVLLIVARLLGKRMSAQTTNIDMGVMLLLGGIVSVPMQMAKVGVVMGSELLVGTLILHRGLAAVTARSSRAADIVEGRSRVLVVDGRLCIHELERTGLPREHLYAALRAKDIHQLGEIRRAYFEACGEISVFRMSPPKPGLGIIPRGEDSEPKVLDGMSACGVCGFTRRRPGADGSPCSECGACAWREAVG